MLEFFEWMQAVYPDAPVWITGKKASLLKNIWMGVSVENQEQADLRIPLLRQSPAMNLWISAEPLLGEVHLRQHLHQIRWVVVGGESGSGARPCSPEWVRDLRDQCNSSNTPFFFKQWGEWGPAPFTNHIPDLAIGGHNPEIRKVGESYMIRCGKKKAGDLLDGLQHHEFPEGMVQ
jgi:hypothetical protein